MAGTQACLASAATIAASRIRDYRNMDRFWGIPSAAFHGDLSTSGLWTQIIFYGISALEECRRRMVTLIQFYAVLAVCGTLNSRILMTECIGKQSLTCQNWFLRTGIHCKRI